MQFTTRPVTRHGRAMVMLSVLRPGGALPVGYFFPNQIPQAKVDFCNKLVFSVAK